MLSLVVFVFITISGVDESKYLDSLKNSYHRVLNCVDCHPQIYSDVELGKFKATCENCHPDINKAFRASAHYGYVECWFCHGEHGVISYRVPGGKVLLVDKCSSCHEAEEKDYKESIHYGSLKKGIKDVPACNDCHSEHFVLNVSVPSSPVSYANIPQTCANCHENKAITDKYGLPARPYQTFLKSYHGIFLSKGVPYAANCVSCHQAHLILPVADLRSSVNPQNLVKTCSKCHPNADWGLTKGKIHIEPTKEVAPHVYAVRLFYTLFISFLVAGFVIHIVFDFIKFRKRKKEMISWKGEF